MDNKPIRQQEHGLWTSVLTGFVLAIVKGVAGYIAMNKALIGDALYTASSAASTLAERLLRRSWKSRRRAALRSEHRPAEGVGASFAQMIITVVLLLGGLEIAIAAVRDLMAHVEPEPKPFAIVLVFLAMAVNEAVFRYRYRYMSKQKSNTLEEMIDTHRYSLYSSIIVLAGMLGTIAALELNEDRLYYVQPVSALLVAIILWRQGYRLARQAIYGRLVQTMEQQDASDYMETVQRVRGVIAVERLQAQEHDRGVHIELVLAVNPNITVLAAAEIAEYARNLLLHRFDHVSRVQVYTIPYTGGYPYKSNHDWATHSDRSSGDGMLH
ncbi:cation transporter [Paenibacillus hunanensis]|uniref:cation diffusion facilitator family transporter n=1 Tax=Paenibacillus hunanensis TaxID=539262 RepID=UPI002A6A391D|nr:cation transporter [Paenibacillus hunanensis]WPP42526.1 cation transporter [Paenibacillus hunanensis]